jgi:putative phage-type endonuclease
MPEVKAPQKSIEWFQARKGRITGSIAGAALGLNPWQTPADAMRTMVREYHGAEREFTGNVATEWGTFNEVGAAYEFSLITGLDVEECGFFEYGSWLGASPDGLVGNGAVVEIKCPFGIRNKSDPVFKNIKEEMPHYYAQIQLEMLCANKTWCYFYQWTPHGYDLQEYGVDHIWIEENLPKLRAFHDLFLIEVKNKDHLEPKLPDIKKKAALDLVAEIDDLKQAIELATERKKEALAELVDEVGEKNCIINGRKFTRVVKAGSISYAAIVKKLRPNLSDKYKLKFKGKDSEFWRLF